MLLWRMRDLAGNKEICRTRILFLAGQGNWVKIPDMCRENGKGSIGLVAVIVKQSFTCFEAGGRKLVIGTAVMAGREGRRNALGNKNIYSPEHISQKTYNKR